LITLSIVSLDHVHRNNGGMHVSRITKMHDYNLSKYYIIFSWITHIQPVLSSYQVHGETEKMKATWDGVD